MTLLYIFIGLYVLAALIVGGVNWASHKDELDSGRPISHEAKIKNLYVMPLCPFINVFAAISILSDMF